MWSSAILDELVLHEARKLVGAGLTEDDAELRAERLITKMSSAFDDALVTGWEPLEGFYSLPDPDDQHVVAAAAKGGAEVIVTSNLRDFPEAQLPEPIRALSPQQFTYDTVRQHVTPACRAVVSICRRSGRKGPELTVDDVLRILRDRYRMVDAVEVLSSAPGLRSSLA